MALITARLKLRSWRDEDLKPYATMNADPRVREFFPGTLTNDESAQSAQSIRDHFRRHGFGLWAVDVIGGPPFIGFIGLAHLAFDAPFRRVSRWDGGWRSTRGAGATLSRARAPPSRSALKNWG